MSNSDLWLRDTATFYGKLIITLFISMLIIVRNWTKLCEIVYKSYLVGFELEFAELAFPYKKELFKILGTMISNDELLRSMGCIRLLEIGVKTGDNIQFYPDNTHFIGVDWNVRLAEYLNDENHSLEFGHINVERLIIGDGSNLKQIKTGSVDVVVSIRSLCSIKSPLNTFDEIKRILAPNGKYIFMEHVPETKGYIVRWLQILLTRSGLWPSLFGNCRLNFDFMEEIKGAGFKRVRSRSITLNGPVSQIFHLTLTGRHVLGVAIR
ncbi:methyltransferase-like protein 7A [Vespula pensylvanica]|uniref:Methyltransferase type 11 domain-containing protein n=1 Tax=Vespula pensylvanica TaxID=30213 RepID=A0A834JJG8_VESPE|nr:methyltransferase-like protein 7A [Vespula pensylvanica]KAF7389603.1 hypothetical protein H0235_018087 [Vespula pensylvanica]